MTRNIRCAVGSCCGPEHSLDLTHQPVRANLGGDSRLTLKKNSCDLEWRPRRERRPRCKYIVSWALRWLLWPLSIFDVVLWQWLTQTKLVFKLTKWVKTPITFLV